MFIWIMLAVFLGIVIGFVTGLAPGIHPNTVFALTLSLMPLVAGFPVEGIIAFIVALSISNVFFDFIPSIIFGAPEEDSVLSVLPGHRMLLEGRGYEAIFLTAMGGLGVVFFTIISLPAMIYFLPIVYSAIKPIIHILLIIAVSWMVYKEKRKLAALLIFTTAGIFGFISLNSFPSDFALFPALTGLFGFSTILTSLMAKTRIPAQKTQEEVHGDWLKGSLAGWIAGLLSGLLPGLGSSQTGIMASQLLKAKVREFLIALGGISASNMLFTFIVFYVLGKTRSGAVWAISQVVDSFTVADVSIVIAVGVLVSLLSAVITIKTGKFMLRKMKNVNYSKVSFSILLMLIALVVLLSGFHGIMISVTGTFLGLLAISAGVKRTHLMGFLVFPTILYFSGLDPLFIGMLW
jgi:putative membrane protein